MDIFIVWVIPVTVTFDDQIRFTEITDGSE